MDREREREREIDCEHSALCHAASDRPHEGEEVCVYRHCVISWDVPMTKAGTVYVAGECL